MICLAAGGVGAAPGYYNYRHSRNDAASDRRLLALCERLGTPGGTAGGAFRATQNPGGPRRKRFSNCHLRVARSVLSSGQNAKVFLFQGFMTIEMWFRSTIDSFMDIFVFAQTSWYQPSVGGGGWSLVVGMVFYGVVDN